MELHGPDSIAYTPKHGPCQKQEPYPLGFPFLGATTVVPRGHIGCAAHAQRPTARTPNTCAPIKCILIFGITGRLWT
jgi:hypothetical protein